MDGFEFASAVIASVASIISALAWPLVVALVIFTFRKEIRQRIPFIRRAELAGAKLEFADAAGNVALATAVASASDEKASIAAGATTTNDRHPLTREFVDVARQDPLAAVNGAWSAIYTRLVNAMGPAHDHPAPSEAANLSRSRDFVSAETHRALMSLQQLKYAAWAAVTTDEALAFLQLADSVLYAVDIDLRATEERAKARPTT